MRNQNYGHHIVDIIRDPRKGFWYAQAHEAFAGRGVGKFWVPDRAGECLLDHHERSGGMTSQIWLVQRLQERERSILMRLICPFHELEWRVYEEEMSRHTVPRPYLDFARPEARGLAHQGVRLEMSKYEPDATDGTGMETISTPCGDGYFLLWGHYEHEKMVSIEVRPMPPREALERVLKDRRALAWARAEVAGRRAHEDSAHPTAGWRVIGGALHEGRIPCGCTEPYFYPRGFAGHNLRSYAQEGYKFLAVAAKENQQGRHQHMIELVVHVVRSGQQSPPIPMRMNVNQCIDLSESGVIEMRSADVADVIRGITARIIRHAAREAREAEERAAREARETRERAKTRARIEADQQAVQDRAGRTVIVNDIHVMSRRPDGYGAIPLSGIETAEFLKFNGAGDCSVEIVPKEAKSSSWSLLIWGTRRGSSLFIFLDEKKDPRPCYLNDDGNVVVVEWTETEEIEQIVGKIPSGVDYEHLL